MKLLREAKTKIANSKWFTRLKSVKNLEIVVAVILALIAIVVYFVIAGGRNAKSASASAEMTENEKRVAEMISEISGVGDARVLISSGADKEIVGVVVVAEGAGGMDNRVKIIRLVEKATGATVDRIEIFEMEKGG